MTGAGADPAERIAAAGASHHQAGRLKEAEDCYRQALALDARHGRTLYLLGIVGLQTGRPDLAAEMIGRAVAEDDRDPEWHYHLALAEQTCGRLDEAAAGYSQALRRNPGYAEAHTNLGNVLTQQGQFDRAEEHYAAVLRLKPGSPETHYNLANVLAMQGRHAEAIDQFHRALSLQPRFAEAHHNLGLALMAMGRAAEARRHLQQATAIKPDFAAAHQSLARALLAEQNAGEALAAAVRALKLDDRAESRALFIEALQSLQSMPDIPVVHVLVSRALDERWCRPALLVGAVYQLAAKNEAVRRALERAGTARLSAGELDPSVAAGLAADPLFCHLLRSTLLTGAAMERLLTAMRRTMLAAAEAGDLDGDMLAFCCALAEQCFINGYVYDAGTGEIARAEGLKVSLADALSSGATVRPAWIAAVAAYQPLHAVPGAQTLLQRGEWPAAIRSLLDRQLRKPLEERKLAAAMPALTEIGAGVSQAVRAQYEESPYPVWTAAPLRAKPVALGTDLRSKFPLASFQPLADAGPTEILIAGCGTGQQAVEIAQQYANANVLAVDLSLASLAYAKRQTIEIGVGNIDYAQADILHLGGLGRTFDAVVSTGVLHHMAEPKAGLGVLLKLLKPGGVMLLGFYSEAAREHLVAAQRYAAERGFAASAPDIRKFRQQIMALDSGEAAAAVVQAADFYSMSECRDLVFHVQEHRFTLPAIKAMLARHGLEFLGFDVAPAVRRQYAAAYPGDPAMTDLDCWHAFEGQHPRTFVGMYQFWVQKRA